MKEYKIIPQNTPSKDVPNNMESENLKKACQFFDRVFAAWEENALPPGFALTYREKRGREGLTSSKMIYCDAVDDDQGGKLQTIVIWDDFKRYYPAKGSYSMNTTRATIAQRSTSDLAQISFQEVSVPEAVDPDYEEDTDFWSAEEMGEMADEVRHGAEYIRKPSNSQEFIKKHGIALDGMLYEFSGDLYGDELGDNANQQILPDDNDVYLFEL